MQTRPKQNYLCPGSYIWVLWETRSAHTLLNEEGTHGHLLGHPGRTEQTGVHTRSKRIHWHYRRIKKTAPIMYEEILLQPPHLEDPIIFILLVDSNLWGVYSNISPLCSTYPTPKTFPCFNDPCHIFSITVFFLHLRFVVNNCDKVMDTHRLTISYQQQDPSTPFLSLMLPFVTVGSHCLQVTSTSVTHS